jgi:hypothetical protein
MTALAVRPGLVPMPRAAGRRIHPAVDLLARVERRFGADPKVALDRAMLIVQRLIECGHVAGVMDGAVPRALPAEPASETAPAHPPG